MKDEKTLRQQRQAKALRENLLKRKEQDRARQIIKPPLSAPSIFVKESVSDVYSS